MSKLTNYHFAEAKQAFLDFYSFRYARFIWAEKLLIKQRALIIVYCLANDGYVHPVDQEIDPLLKGETPLPPPIGLAINIIAAKPLLP